MPKKSPSDAPPGPEPEAPGSQPLPSPQHSSRFFDWIRSLNLVRQPGWMGGVASGIADRLGIDVVIVRGVLVVVAVLGGPAIFLYAIAWLLLPDNTNRIHLEELRHGKADSPLIAIVALIALSLLPITQGFWWFGSLYWGGQPDFGSAIGRSIWTVVILALLIWLVSWFSRRRAAAILPTIPATTDDRPETIPLPFIAEPATTAAEPPSAPPADATSDELAAWRADQEKWKAESQAFKVQQAQIRQAAARAAADAARVERRERSAGHRAARASARSNPLYSVALIGIALIVGAVVPLVIGKGSPDPFQFLIGAAIAVGILGLGIIVNGARGKRGGGATAVAVILMIPLALAGIFPQSNTLKYSGNWTIVAHGQQGLLSNYELGSGNVTLDARTYFSTPRPKSGPDQGGSEINLYVGSGNVKILVPSDEYVETNTNVLTGSNSSVGHHAFYVGDDREEKNETRNIYIQVVLGSGHITIVRDKATTGAPAS